MKTIYNLSLEFFLLVSCYFIFILTFNRVYSWYKIFHVYFIEYSLYHRAFIYNIKILNKCGINEYSNNLWLALNSIESWENHKCRLIDIKVLEWDNGTRISINKFIEIDNEMTNEMFNELIKDSLYGIYNLAPNSYLEIYVRYYN